MPCEDIGPRLVADPQRVAESPRNRQSQPFAFAFEQRIGGHGGADAQLRHRTRTVLRHQAPHRFAGGIVVMAGVLRQQLVGHQLPVGRHCHDIGEGPAAIDREAPCALVCLVAHVRRHSHAFAGNSNRLRRTGARSLRNSPKRDVNFWAVGRCRRAEGVCPHDTRDHHVADCCCRARSAGRASYRYAMGTRYGRCGFEPVAAACTIIHRGETVVDL